VLYLIIIVVGLFGEAFVRNGIIVAGDASATAANLKSMESLWRFGIAAEFFLLICAIALTLIFYVLLRPVSRELALLVVFFSLVSIAVEATAALNLVAALFPLGNAAYLKAFAPEQLYALASLSVKSHGYGFGVALIFFGCECLVLGYLIFRSGYLPKAVGILMQIVGLSYLTNSFALLLAPDFANRIFPAILVPAFVGETSLCLWLLVKGVNMEKWELRAEAQPGRRAAATIQGCGFDRAPLAPRHPGPPAPRPDSSQGRSRTTPAVSVAARRHDPALAPLALQPSDSRGCTEREPDGPRARRRGIRRAQSEARTRDPLRKHLLGVVSREIVTPDAVRVLQPTAKPRLTLITCYPFNWVGPAPRRLVVVAEPLLSRTPPVKTVEGGG